MHGPEDDWRRAGARGALHAGESGRDPHDLIGRSFAPAAPHIVLRSAHGPTSSLLSGEFYAQGSGRGVRSGTPAGPYLASAQTPYIPYFGKNQIRYDNFDWQIYTTDHFEIYYYPEIEQHLERVAGYAESAYQQISSELKYDLAFKIPLILFKTSSEFQQQNVIPGAAQEGVAHSPSRCATGS